MKLEKDKWYFLLFLCMQACSQKPACVFLTPNYNRLQTIEVDCKGNTYGECIIKYDNALKKSNNDKETIMNDFQTKKNK